MTHIRSGNSETNRYRVGNLVLEKNFGMLKIWWENGRPVVSMQVHGLNNVLLMEQVVRY